MRIIFVRHGHPDYAKDCLTELGHKHAKAASERLKDERIDKFYASSCGRAYETAVHIAEGRGMDVEKLDFLREIGWGPIGRPFEPGFDPWTLSNKMVESGQSLMSAGWHSEEPYNTSIVTERTLLVGDGIDKLLMELGYERDGDFYRVRKPKFKTVLIASHGGSSSAVFARMFNLPMPFVCTAICPEFTAITVVSLDGEEGQLISPRFEILNDARHIAGITTDNVYGR